MGYIRRVNLDVMWSRESSTVRNTLGGLKKAHTMSMELGLPGQPLRMGPWPVDDTVGFQTAIEMLRASQAPGRNAKTYTQFDSIRKIRTSYAVGYENSYHGFKETDVYKGEGGQSFVITRNKTDSRFFRKFMRGLEKRMGRLVIQNLGITHELLSEILQRYDEELATPVSPERKRWIIVFATGLVILFCAALRGNELFLMEAREFCSRISDGCRHATHPHVVLPFRGRFKGETGERNIIFLLANITFGGIPVRMWCERLSNLLMWEKRNLMTGPAFCDPKGLVLSSSDFDQELHRVLVSIQIDMPDLIDKSISVEDRFSIYRSLRRGATTRATELEIDERIVNMNNRWRKFQNRSGGMPNLPMGELYTDMLGSLKSRTAFSRQL